MDRKAVKERCKTLATKSIAASQVADIYLKDTFQKMLTVHKQATCQSPKIEQPTQQRCCFL